MNQTLTKQNTISAEIVLDCFDYQSDRNCTARMVQPTTQSETTMLVAIGKGIELDVDVTRFNSDVQDHIVRTGVRNLLMDSHASATAKADPDNYIKRSREMAEKKLASLYQAAENITQVTSFPGLALSTSLECAAVACLGSLLSFRRLLRSTWAT